MSLAPKLCLGTNLSPQLRCCLFLAPRIDPQYWYRARQPLMRRRISPMVGRRDQAPFHWVVVKIIQLLQHDLIRRDGLRVNSLLPNLMRAHLLVRGAKVTQLIHQPEATFHFELVENRMSCELLQIGNGAREI